MGWLQSQRQIKVCVGEDIEQLENSYTANEGVNGAAPLENQKVPQKIKQRMTI